MFRALRSEYGTSNLDLKSSRGGCLSVILPEEVAVALGSRWKSSCAMMNRETVVKDEALIL